MENTKGLERDFITYSNFENLHFPETRHSHVTALLNQDLEETAYNETDVPFN